MEVIKIKDEELDIELDVNVKTSWSEANLNDCLRITDLLFNRENMDDEIFLVKMLSIISDAKEEDLLQVSPEELEKMLPMFKVFSNDDVDINIPDNFEIDGVLYVPKKNMKNISTAEIRFIRESNKNRTAADIYNIYLNIIVCLVRPGYIKEEDGKKRSIMYKFLYEDIEERKEILKNKLSASIALSLIKAFISGTKE